MNIEKSIDIIKSLPKLKYNIDEAEIILLAERLDSLIHHLKGMNPNNSLMPNKGDKKDIKAVSNAITRLKKTLQKIESTPAIKNALWHDIQEKLEAKPIDGFREYPSIEKIYELLEPMESCAQSITAWIPDIPLSKSFVLLITLAPIYDEINELYYDATGRYITRDQSSLSYKAKDYAEAFIKTINAHAGINYTAEYTIRNVYEDREKLLPLLLDKEKNKILEIMKKEKKLKSLK